MSDVPFVLQVQVVVTHQQKRLVDVRYSLPFPVIHLYEEGLMLQVFRRRRQKEVVSYPWDVSPRVFVRWIEDNGSLVDS